MKIKRIEIKKNYDCFDLGIFIGWNPLSNWDWSGITIGLAFWRLEIEVEEGIQKK